MNERPLRHLDLFSGIGGFALAADRVFGNVEHTFCEIDPFCQAVLKKHWPHSPVHGDIKTLSLSSEQFDLLTGGFPCQPFSVVGRRRGKEDDRHLWPEMLRVIRETRPTWVIGENVRGLVSWDGGLVLEEVFSDLEAIGYEVGAFIIPAVAVNAPHRRDRVWIVADSRSSRRQQIPGGPPCHESKNERRSAENYHQFASFDEKPWPEVAAELCREDDGVPHRLDRLAALGNAIVPQVAQEVMRAIDKSGL